jgi:hypothetical protein
MVKVFANRGFASLVEFFLASPSCDPTSSPAAAREQKNLSYFTSPHRGLFAFYLFLTTCTISTALL